MLSVRFLSRTLQENYEMHIQVNTDKNIVGQEAMTQSVEEILGRVLERFSGQIMNRPGF